MVKQNIQRLIDAGWTQHRIALETGISQPSVNRILRGRQLDVHYTQGKKLEQIVALLDTNVIAKAKKSKVKVAQK